VIFDHLGSFFKSSIHLSHVDDDGGKKPKKPKSDKEDDFEDEEEDEELRDGKLRFAGEKNTSPWPCTRSLDESSFPFHSLC
jgi:hypothetical protein